MYFFFSSADSLDGLFAANSTGTDALDSGGKRECVLQGQLEGETLTIPANTYAMPTIWDHHQSHILEDPAHPTGRRAALKYTMGPFNMTPLSFESTTPASGNVEGNDKIKNPSHNPNAMPWEAEVAGLARAPAVVPVLT
ncbi:hypothetical protein C0995_004168 [Termitomyces sp. Mi166|nr:hypothetical protein C0995_004168 [Termitomyces sp. Mi166\